MTLDWLQALDQSQPLSWLQAAVLALIQGLTEFLPISSSGHLLLPSLLFGWPDQGLAFDVAVHCGSLLAVLLYFRRDLRRLFTAWLGSVTAVIQGANSKDGENGISGDSKPSHSISPPRYDRQNARLAWCLLIGTVPAAAAGPLLSDFSSGMARSLWVVGTTSIAFALLLFYADRRSRADRRSSASSSVKQNSQALPSTTPGRSLPNGRGLMAMNYKSALWIGIAQALALIPGTSRSGITITAALLCGFSREAAARFSFLLAIPVITASTLFTVSDSLAQPAPVKWSLLIYAATLSAVVAYSCIHLFLKLIERIGYLPFILYRLALGTLLLFLAISG